MDRAILRVYVNEEPQKFVLPTGIPNTVEELKLALKDAFGLPEQFGVQYMDMEFNDFFVLTATNQIEHKGTIKVVYPPAPVILTFSCASEDAVIPSTSQLSNKAVSFAVSQQPAPSPSPPEFILHAYEDGGASEQQEVHRDPVQPSSGRLPWPKNFPVPGFSPEVGRALQTAMEAYRRNGTLMDFTRIEKEIKEKLAQAIYVYTVYPSGLQLAHVAETLIQKYPCLKEPGPWAGLQGWKARLRNKMADYRRRLSKFGCPEVTINALKNKNCQDRKPAKNVKKPRKAEVNYLPPYPVGETDDSLENEREELLTEVKKRNNAVIIKQKMSKTFALRRREVVIQAPSVASIKERWPALFDIVNVSHLIFIIT